MDEACRQTCAKAAPVLPPEVHLMLPGSPRRFRELGRGDRDRYAWSSVGGESKCRGRLSVTIARKRALASAIATNAHVSRVGKGLNPPALRIPTGKCRFCPGSQTAQVLGIIFFARVVCSIGELSSTCMVETPASTLQIPSQSSQNESALLRHDHQSVQSRTCKFYDNHHAEF